MSVIEIVSVGGFGFYPLEMLSAAVVLALPLEKRNHLMRRSLMLAVCYLALYACWVAPMSVLITQYSEGGTTVSVYDLTDSLAGFMISTTAVSTVLFGLSTLLILWVCRVSPREAVYAAACAYVMEHLCYCVRILEEWALAPLEITAGGAVYFADLIGVYALVYLLFVRRMAQRGHYGTSAINSCGLTLGVLVVVLVMSVFASAYALETLHAIYATFICIYLFVSQVRQQRQLALERQVALEEDLWERQRSQLEASRESADFISHRAHGLLHRVAELKGMSQPEVSGEVVVEAAEYAETQELLNTVEQAARDYDAAFETGNNALDTILTDKALRCRNEGMEFVCIADGEALAGLPTMDLYALVGTILDEVIGAARLMPEGERLVRFVVRRRGGLVLVQAEAACGDKGAAAGLPSGLESIAGRAGGIIQHEVEGGVLRIRITFPEG